MGKKLTLEDLKLAESEEGRTGLVASFVPSETKKVEVKKVIKKKR